MKRTDVTYGQLDNVLRLLGFSYRSAKHDPPGHIYKHKETGVVVMLPEFAESKKIFEYHLTATDGVLWQTERWTGFLNPSPALFPHVGLAPIRHGQ